MKILIISDIHGSLYYAKEIPNILKREQADKIILLGDLYYHGLETLFQKNTIQWKCVRF